MKKIGIILTVLLGLLLRLVAIDKSEGLWNDEYVSYMIAATPFTDGFWHAVKSQCHMPFYYLYLKMTMLLFNSEDIVLRLSSVLAGIFSIIAMYFVGKERNTRVAFYCAIFTAFSSFLIYYSQEVRLYSILFLFSALTLLFTIRLVKKPDIKNLCLFALSAFLVLFTHTIGFVFLFFLLVYLSYKLYHSHKQVIVKLWIIIAVLLLLLTPLIVNILFKQSFSQWWGSFSFSAIGFLITDYFSPVITNFTGAPPNFFYNFKSGFIIFALTPAIIAVGFLINALKEKSNREIFYIALGTIIIMLVASLFGKLVFITKYSIEIYPILIYLACIGAESINNKVIKNVFIGIFCLLNLFFLLVSPLAANKIYRKEGHKLVADIIQNANLKKGDVIILQYYDTKRFKKYYDFSDVTVISINKGNFPQYIASNISYKDVYKNENIIRKQLASNSNSYFETQLINKIKPKENKSVLLIVLKSVSFLNTKSIQKITSNDEYYSQTPILFLVFSYLKNQTFNTLSKYYESSEIMQNGEWAAVKFTKLNK